MTSDDSAFTIDTPLAGAVRAVATFDPDTGRYTLHLSGNEHVRGTLSILPDIVEDDEHDARTATELEPYLTLATRLGQNATDESALSIFGERQSAAEIARRGRVDMDAFTSVTEDRLLWLGNRPQRGVHLALILALARTVDQDPRREQIAATWAREQRRLSDARTREALGQVEAELLDLNTLRDRLRAQLRHPFPPRPDDE